MAILGKVRYNLKGEWSSSSSYLVDDVIYYKNRTYRCKSAHTNAVPPNTTYWEAMVVTFDDMGAWNSSTAYKVGDVVTVDARPTPNGSHPRGFNSARPLIRPISTYVCIADNTNVAPPTAKATSSAYWALLSEGGNKNFVKFGWPANGGQVPATGVFESGATPGWDSSLTVNGVSAAARPQNDSIEAGGLGYACRTGVHHPSFISRSGGYITWGYTSSGSSGAGGNDHVPGEFMEISFPFNEWYEGVLPTPDGKAPKVIQAFNYLDGNFVLMNNGEIYSWGYGGHGQNGSGNNNSINFPVRCGNNNNTTVLRGKKAIRIATTNCGNTTASAMARYALMSDGTLWSWGYNGYGQLGLGNTTNYNVPTQITTSGLNGTVVDIWACGGDYGSLFVLTSTGYMYSCGRNAQGQLGWNGTTNSSTLGQVKIWGTTTTKVKKFFYHDQQDATSIGVIDASNQLWTWGYNGYGQLGFDNTTNLSTPTAVTYNGTDVRNAWFTSGDYTSLYVTRTSSLQPYSCGYNGYYNLGRPYSDANRTHSNGGNSATAWDTYRLQPMYFETSTTAPYYGTLTNVVDIKLWQHTSSYTAVMVEQIDGTKYCGGYNGYGHFGFHHSDSYLNRARDCAGNTSNYLFKRLRYIPSGVTEAELGCIPVATDGNYFGAIWYDKDGTMYQSGYGAHGESMRNDQWDSRVTWMPVITKLPGA